MEDACRQQFMPTVLLLPEARGGSNEAIYLGAIDEAAPLGIAMLGSC
jgi:hypothetical protein